jgi:hypothetical protein
MLGTDAGVYALNMKSRVSTTKEEEALDVTRLFGCDTGAL